MLCPRNGAGVIAREACVTEAMPDLGPDEVVEPDEAGTDLVVVTGLSGGGRSTVARALERSQGARLLAARGVRGRR
jgi:adenylylsulfate kinase-like enzyme